MQDTTHTSTLTRVALAMLELFVVAFVAALVVTLATVSAGVQFIAAAAVVPIIFVSLILVYYCRKGRAWGFAVGSILGVLGVALRVVVNTQPSLEVGGGLPLSVTVPYIALGALMSLTNFMAYMERKAGAAS